MQRYDLTVGKHSRSRLTLHECVRESLRYVALEADRPPVDLPAEGAHLVTRFENDPALNEITWRSWIRGDLFVGDETDVIRHAHVAYALITPGPFVGVSEDALDGARRALLEWAGATAVPSSAEESSVGAGAAAGSEASHPLDPAHGDDRRLRSGMPAPLHFRGRAGETIRDALSRDGIARLERLSSMTEGELPGLRTLLAAMDLPSAARARSSQPTAMLDRVAHAERLLLNYERMAAGAVITLVDEIRIALEGIDASARDIALRQWGFTGVIPSPGGGTERSQGVSAANEANAAQMVNLICASNPLPMPICVATWCAFPRELEIAHLSEWHAAIPPSIRPQDHSDLCHLQVLNEWNWLPEAGWILDGKMRVASVQGPFSAATGGHIDRLSRSVAEFRSWGATTVDQCVARTQGIRDVHPHLVRALLHGDSRWVPTGDGWFVFRDPNTRLAKQFRRWRSAKRPVPAALFRKKLVRYAIANAARFVTGPVPPAAALKALREISSMPGAAPPRPRRVRVVPERPPASDREAAGGRTQALAANGAHGANGAEDDPLLTAPIKLLFDRTLPDAGMPGPSLPADALHPFFGDAIDTLPPPTTNPHPESMTQQSAGYVELAPGQARYVVQRLIEGGRVSAAEVIQLVSEMHQEIDDLQQRLRFLRAAAGMADPMEADAASATVAAEALGRLSGPVGRAESSDGEDEGAPGRTRRRRRMNLSPEAIESRRKQGRYLGLIRQIPQEDRDFYRELAKESGREAAIEAIEKELAAGRSAGSLN